MENYNMPPEIRQVWDSSRSKMVAYATRLLRSRSDAEEVVNDSFVSAIRGLPNFRRDANLTTWIYVIVRNRACNKFHYWKRRKKDLTIGIDELFGLYDESDDTRSAIQFSEFDDQVRLAYGNIEKKHREILDLRLEGNSYEEIATQMNTQVGTVKSRLSRARGALVKKINSSAKIEDRIPLGKLVGE